MKKLLLTCAIALSMFVIVACSSKAGKAVDIIKDATEQVKAAKGDTAEVRKINEAMTQKLKDLTEGMSQEDKDKLEKEEKVKAAIDEYNKTYGEAYKTAYTE